MFNAILEAPPLLSSTWFKSGAGLSILAHIALVAGALIVHRASATQSPEKTPTPITFFGKRPPKGNPNPPLAALARTAPTKPKAASKVTPPRTIVPLPANATAPAAPALQSNLPFIEGSDENGAEHEGVAHAPSRPGPSGLGGEDVVVFGEGMTKPRLLGGPEIQYTREAREARVEGMVIARCTVTRDGEVRACHVVKGLPFMTGAVVEALQARRYSPATFQGQVLAVNYVFNVKLKMQ